MMYENEQIQTVTGKDKKECITKLYNMYGYDYKVINMATDFKSAGFLGLRKEPYYYVNYIVTHNNSYVKNKTSIINRDAEQTENRLSEAELMQKNREDILKNNQNYFLTSTLKEMAQQIQNIQKDMNENFTSIANATSEKHETIKKIEELLQENEFTFSYIQMIDEKIRSAFSLDQLEDFELVERYVVDWIGETINVAKEKVYRPPHVIIVVGPTGVGKTTTIAKMASTKIIEAKRNNRVRPELCLITIDTMRVGALEQLSKFGDILGKKVLKAETSEDVKKIYDENKAHVDYVFIDTSGYSPNDSKHIGYMKNILSVDNLNPDVYLSVCATTKASDLNNIFRNYEPFGYNSIIVTKWDETTQIGNVISVLYDKHKTVSYITDGQHVPANIRKASVIDFLVSLKGFNIDRSHIEDKFGEKE